ncbi:MAG: DUF4180 domain-containing protein, partial [FCB group bacterium]|nr:DUF4180 domain-containing protein [FCB group bacterium]
MKLKIIKIHHHPIAVLEGTDHSLASVQDVLDLLADAGYQGAKKIMIKKEHLHPDFFDLKTGLAGEMLQVDDLPAAAEGGLLPDRPAAGEFDLGRLQPGGRGDLERNFTTLVAVLGDQHGGLVRGVQPGHRLGDSVEAGLVIGPDLGRPLLVTQQPSHQHQVAPILIGRLEVDVDDLDPDPLQAGAQFV